MEQRRCFRVVPLMAALVLVAAPLAAQVGINPTGSIGIPKGVDSWATPGGGGTYIELNAADWEAICGVQNGASQQIIFKGVHIAGEGDNSVEVERLDDAVFNSSGLAYVNVRMKTLEFESTSTSSTPCPQGNLDFRVVLDGTQPTAVMEIQRQGSWGGHFFVDLPVNAIVEALHPSTGAVVGSTTKAGTLYDPTGGTPWSYNPPANPLDPNAPWHPGVTSTGQRVNIVRHHTWPASHLYKPVTYCQSTGTGTTNSTSGTGVEGAEPACAEPVPNEDPVATN